MRLTAEACSQINITDLQKKVRKVITRDYPESTEEEIYSHMANELKKFVVNGQAFEYSSQRTYLGGYRWYFICPKCKKRSNKLLLPPETLKDHEQLYQCKICHGIRNRSTSIGQSTLYQTVTKPLRRMKQIEDKIAIGHLTMDKVQDLLDEYETIEKGLKTSPEYRLYMFKRKHNMLPK